MVSMDDQAIRMAVRERYARAATAGISCCGSQPVTFLDGRPVPEAIASASLGCGAPIEAAALRPGETVVDLGSGAGLDVFFAADRVGPIGRAIGVDMTLEMIAKARANAVAIGATNVEFRLGEIERLPVPDASADAVISNCVINLLPDKRPAFAEAFRILRPGGRLIVSDIVSARPLPEEFKTPERWTACLAGAIPEVDYLGIIEQVGFSGIEVLERRGYEGADLFSVTVLAVKPGRE